MAKGKRTLHEKIQFHESFLGNLGENPTTINIQIVNQNIENVYGHKKRKYDLHSPTDQEIVAP